MHVISRENFLIMYVVFNYNLKVQKGEINYSSYPEIGETQNIKLIEDALENILPTVQFKCRLRAQPPDELLDFQIMIFPCHWKHSVKPISRPCANDNTLQ